MPLPTPNSGEEKSDFISRCASELATNEKSRFPEQDQRLAVCYSQWKQKNESIEIESYISDETVTADVEKNDAVGHVDVVGFFTRRKKRKNVLTGRDLIVHEVNRANESQSIISAEKIVDLFGKTTLAKFHSVDDAFNHITRNLKDLGYSNIDTKGLMKKLQEIIK